MNADTKIIRCPRCKSKKKKGLIYCTTCNYDFSAKNEGVEPFYSRYPKATVSGILTFCIVGLILAFICGSLIALFHSFAYKAIGAARNPFQSWLAPMGLVLFSAVMGGFCAGFIFGKVALKVHIYNPQTVKTIGIVVGILAWSIYLIGFFTLVRKRGFTQFDFDAFFEILLLIFGFIVAVIIPAKAKDVMVTWIMNKPRTLKGKLP